MIQDQVSDFECQCASGYHGDKCETESNECASNPCRNAIRCHVSSIYHVPPKHCITSIPPIAQFLLSNSFRIESMATSVSVWKDSLVQTVKMK